jgi:hypothetical protein
MYQATLNNNITAYFAHCLKQGLMSVTGNAFYLDTQAEQVFQIFFYFFIPFSICQPVELCVFYAIVPVKDQAQIITEVSSINKQVNALRWPYNENGSFGQIAMKISF